MMMVNQIDVRQHPLDATALVMWILDRWAEDEGAKLFIAAGRGQGESWVNRIRVRLSATRSAMRRQRKQFIEFGFHDIVIPWSDDLDDIQHDMIILNRVMTKRHRMLTAFRQVGF